MNNIVNNLFIVFNITNTIYKEIPIFNSNVGGLLHDQILILAFITTRLFSKDNNNSSSRGMIWA
jgi:hypothetical protein